MALATTQQDVITTADGVPLGVSMQRSLRRACIKAFALVAPLLIFILIAFVLPIGDLLFYSVDHRQINTVLPRTFENFDNWNREGLPDDELYAALFEDVTIADKLALGRATTRMNYEKSGYSLYRQPLCQHGRTRSKTGRLPESLKPMDEYPCRRGWSDTMGYTDVQAG